MDEVDEHCSKATASSPPADWGSVQILYSGRRFDQGALRPTV